MQRDHFLSRVGSLQERLSQVKERIRLSDEKPATNEALGDLRTAIGEMILLEQQLVKQNKELAAARESAEEEAHRYQNLFELTPEAYLVTDGRGVIIEANEAAGALLKRPGRSIIGTSLGIYVVPESFKNFLLDASAAHRKHGSQFETRLHRPSADPIHVSVTLSTSADKTSLRWLIRDITARVQTEERLRISERVATMGATALLLAQEISNPLNSMFTTVQRLERELNRQDQLGEPFRSTLQDLARETNRLRGLLQKFRSFSRPVHFNLDSLDLGAMLAQITSEEAGACAERGIQIQVEESFPGLTVKADCERLKQALVNLCRNAVEAMPHGGKLIITGSRRNDQIRVEFMDTGIGVTKDIDVFDLFTTTKFQAMGTGLPIARQIIADHGGKIGYMSVPGKTVFHVILPAGPHRSETS